MSWLPEVDEHVVHRAWKTKGVVVDVPKNINHLSRVGVEWESGEKGTSWVPSLMPDFDYMIFDWSDGDERLLDTDDWPESED